MDSLWLDIHGVGNHSTKNHCVQTVMAREAEISASVLWP